MRAMCDRMACTTMSMRCWRFSVLGERINLQSADVVLSVGGSNILTRRARWLLTWTAGGLASIDCPQAVCIRRHLLSFEEEARGPANSRQVTIPWR